MFYCLKVNQTKFLQKTKLINYDDKISKEIFFKIFLVLILEHSIPLL